jgi:hypothetical protein
MVGLGKRQKNDPGTDDRSNKNCSNPVVYVRYKDHVLFKNFQQPIDEAIERETLGWLAKENSDIILFEHDRTIRNLPVSGQTNGLVILKSCILEFCSLPLQKNSKLILNSPEDTDRGEYALQPKKRKTPKNRTGATK